MIPYMQKHTHTPGRSWMALLVEGVRGGAWAEEPVGDMIMPESPFMVLWFSLVIAPHLSRLHKRKKKKHSFQNRL